MNVGEIIRELSVEGKVARDHGLAAKEAVETTSMCARQCLEIATHLGASIRNLAKGSTNDERDEATPSITY